MHPFLISGANFNPMNPYQLDVFGSNIYFTTKRIADNYVMVVGKNPDQKPPELVIRRTVNTLGSLKVYHPLRYPAESKLSLSLYLIWKTLPHFCAEKIFSPSTQSTIHSENNLGTVVYILHARTHTTHTPHAILLMTPRWFKDHISGSSWIGGVEDFIGRKFKLKKAWPIEKNLYLHRA